jgi:hypothetical protein
MSTEFSKRDEAASIFGRARPLIDVTLRREFRLPKADAQQLEEDVGLWFSRFSDRPGNGKTSLSYRTELFWAACQAAHRYWQWKLDGQPVADGRIKRALSRDPREMAVELEKKARERDKRSRPMESGT